MDDKKIIESWRDKFVSLESDSEREKFDKEFLAMYNAKSEEDKKVFSQAFKESAMEACERADKLCDRVEIWFRLRKIKDFVSMSYIAEHYFKKSRSWFSQRLNMHEVNGVRVSFTDEELKILSNALNEMGEQIKETAASI